MNGCDILLHTQTAKHHGCNEFVHCCMPRPQSIVFHIASMAPAMLFKNSLHPWCFAVWVCNNTQCTMQQLRRKPFLNLVYTQYAEYTLLCYIFYIGEY